MAGLGLVPAIHAFDLIRDSNVDARDDPRIKSRIKSGDGHDESNIMTVGISMNDAWSGYRSAVVPRDVKTS